MKKLIALLKKEFDDKKIKYVISDKYVHIKNKKFPLNDNTVETLIILANLFEDENEIIKHFNAAKRIITQESENFDMLDSAEKKELIKIFS